MSIATKSPTAATRAPAEQGSHHLRLARLRDQERQRRLTIVTISAIGTLALLAGLVTILDFYFELPALVRLFAWAVIVLSVTAVVMVMRPWRTFDSIDAVCEAERAWPDMGQRLRTSHDYQTIPDQVSPANAELIRALESETQQRVIGRLTQPLGRPWPIFALLGLCGAVATIWLAALIAVPDWRVATARTMLIPVHYSSVRLEPLPDHVHLGSDLVVQLHVNGRPLESARVLHRTHEQPTWQEVPLLPEVAGELTGNVSALLPDCRSDFEIRVDAGPLQSGIHPIAVRLPLVLEEWLSTVTPPAYTKLPASEGSPDGLRIPAGSTVQLAARYNRPPSQVDVELSPQSVSVTRPEITDSQAVLSIDINHDPIDLSVLATASDSMVDDSSLHIDVVPDRRPELKFVVPEEDAEVISTAELRFTLQAMDDYGLASLGIRYRIDDGPEQTLWESESVDEVAEMAKSITLPLEDLDVKYPQAITYYAYALDNRQPEPQRVTSLLRFVDIRPFSRDYELRQSNGSCQGECLTLEKLIKQQRGILGRTFVVAQSGSVQQSVTARLARDQQTLQSKTESLTKALEEKLGPMPSLQSAIGSMSSAIEHLSSSAIQEGQSDEEQALAGLVAARKNLRNVLVQNDSKAQMCRNIDRQQMDKIRKPQRDSERQQEQLAQLRKRIDQLAEQQDGFCESVKECQQAGQLSLRPGQSSQKKTASELQAIGEQLATQQQQATAEADDLQKQLVEGDFGTLAPERMRQAAESIQQSSVSLSEPDQAQAIREAARASQQLKRLSQHLGQRHDPNFVEKLSAAGRQAKQLSDQQRQLSQSLAEKTPSDQDDTDRSAQQATLLRGAEELVDLVDRLQAESIEQDWEVQRALSEQITANPPRRGAADMREATAELEHGRTKSASVSGSRAAGTLQRFANGIVEIQKAMAPAQLEKLVQAEKRAAELLKEMKRANNSAQQARVRSETRAFADSMHSLSNADAELAAATKRLEALEASAGRTTESLATDREASVSTQIATPQTTLADGLRNVDEILQRRIQEAIVGGVMQQAVGAVPPQYSRMVEEYYRVLSEDVE